MGKITKRRLSEHNFSYFVDKNIIKIALFFTENIFPGFQYFNSSKIDQLYHLFLEFHVISPVTSISAYFL